MKGCSDKGRNVVKAKRNTIIDIIANVPLAIISMIQLTICSEMNKH